MSDPHTYLFLKVFGTPAPAGSKKGFVIKSPGAKGGHRAVLVDDAKNSRPWKAAISAEAGAKMNGREIFRGALSAEFVFFRKRPKSHFNSKGALKASAPRFPTSKPDVLKLARAVEDALTGIVYADDAQICYELLVKCYGEPERVEISIQEPL